MSKPNGKLLFAYQSIAALEDKLSNVDAENKLLRGALSKIASIEDEQYGGDWDEIEEARNVASEALAQHGKAVGDE